MICATTEPESYTADMWEGEAHEPKREPLTPPPIRFDRVRERARGRRIRSVNEPRRMQTDRNRVR
jgi:hypothetical protein